MNKILLKSGAIILLIIFVCKMVNAQDPNFHIYLCLGQSNMEGQAAIEEQDKKVDSRFQVMGSLTCTGTRSFTLGKWAPATPPIFRCDTKLSLVDHFGKSMVAALPANIKVGVVPVAVAGSDIALFDKVNYATYANSPNTASYMKNIINAYGGNPYGRLVEIAKIAQKDGVIKGILFHQGETNTGQTDWPNKVKAVYDNLIKDLSLDPTKIPLLVGEVVTADQSGCCSSHNTIIARVPKVIPNSYVISASGLAAMSDNTHFTSASYRTLGDRYAAKMLTLLALTGIEIGTELKGSSIAPNPFKDVLELVKDGSFNYELTDTIGHILESGSGENKININPKIERGIYLLKISQENNSKIFKVVKE